MSREQVRSRRVERVFQLKNQEISSPSQQRCSKPRRTTCFSVKKYIRFSHQQRQHIFNFSQSRVLTRISCHCHISLSLSRENGNCVTITWHFRSARFRGNEFHMRIILCHATWCITCWLGRGTNTYHRSQWAVIYGVQLASLSMWCTKAASTYFNHL